MPVVFHFQPQQSWQLFFSGLLLLAFPGWRYYYSQYIKIYKFLEVSERKESYNEMTANKE